MRGTILGYGDNKGVIVTDDGRRFNFTGENWREPEPPVRGTQVDFVEQGDAADEIYLALGAAQPAPMPAAPPPASAAAAPPIAHDPSGAQPPPAAGSDPGQAADQALRRMGASIRAFPQGLLAVLILFTFLVISYAAIGGAGAGMRGSGLSMREYPTLMALNDTLSPFREEVAQLGDQLDRRRESLANSPEAPGIASEFRVRQAQEIERTGSAYSRLSWTLIGAYFFWFIPLLCIAVVVLKLAGKRRLAIASSVALGVLSLIAAFYVMLLEGAVFGLAESQFGPGFEGRAELRRSIGRAFDLGFGGYLIGILGLACIAVLFLPRRSDAAPAEEGVAPVPAVEPPAPA